jgi:mannosyltransferase OCH1-like enzyme
MKIPKIINKIYLCHSKNLPKKMDDVDLQRAHDSWNELNPDYLIRYFNMNDCEEYLLTNFNEKYLNIFKKIKPYSYKCDFFRFCVVYNEGGFYSDWKQHCLLPINTILNDDLEWISCYDTGNDYARNTKCMGTAFFGAIPKHPILKETIDYIMNNVENNFYGYSPLDPTGPHAFGIGFKNFCKKQESDLSKKNYLFGNFDWNNFYSFENETIKLVQHKCNNTNMDQNWNNGNNYVEMWYRRDIYL